MPDEINDTEDDVTYVLEMSSLELVPDDDPSLVTVHDVYVYNLPSNWQEALRVHGFVHPNANYSNYVTLYINEDHTFSCDHCGERYPDALEVEWVRPGRSTTYSVCIPCDENDGVSCENSCCGVRLNMSSAVTRSTPWETYYYCEDDCAPEEEEDEDDDDSDYYDGDRRNGRNVTLPNGRPLIEHYHHTDEHDDNFRFTEYIALPDTLVAGEFAVTSIKRHTLVVHRRVPDKFPALGFELEKKIRDTSKRIEAAQFLLEGVRDNYLVLKEDATVNGWETVTYPADWRAHMELFPWDKLPVLANQYGLYAWNDRDRMCGLHVHISRSAFKPSHLHRFVSFHDNHITQLVKFSGRHNRTYAPHGRDYYDDRKLQAMGLRGSSHSVAVNFGSGNSKTIELRYFRGSLKPETIKSALQFTHALWLFTKDMTSNDVRYGANTFDKFIAFASENVAEYPDLYPRLVERGLTEVTS